MVITESSLCDSSSSRYSRPFSPRTGALDGVTLMAETRTQSLRMVADQHLKYLAASALIAQQISTDCSWRLSHAQLPAHNGDTTTRQCKAAAAAM
jgi:hypothetical protein